MSFFDDIEDDITPDYNEEVTKSVTKLISGYKNYPKLNRTNLPCVPLSKLTEVIDSLTNKNVILYSKRGNRLNFTPELGNDIALIYSIVSGVTYCMPMSKEWNITDKLRSLKFVSIKLFNKKTAIITDAYHSEYLLNGPANGTFTDRLGVNITFDCIIDLNK